jgi:hypothetical protein
MQSPGRPSRSIAAAPTGPGRTSRPRLPSRCAEPDRDCDLDDPTERGEKRLGQSAASSHPEGIRGFASGGAWSGTGGNLLSRLRPLAGAASCSGSRGTEHVSFTGFACVNADPITSAGPRRPGVLPKRVDVSVCNSAGCSEMFKKKCTPRLCAVPRAYVVAPWHTVRSKRDPPACTPSGRLNLSEEHLRVCS